MEHVRLHPAGCNKFPASPRRRFPQAWRSVRPVGGFGIVLLTILIVAPACSPRPVDRVRKIQSLPRQAATFKKMHRYLADSDASVRAAAVDALDAGSGPEAVRAITVALEDKDATVRSMAARRLAEIGDAKSIELLLGHLESDADWTVRQRCAEGLGSLAPAGAEAGLARATADAERAVRLAAVRALSSSFASVSIESLSRSLAEDPDWEIRVEAASGLARAQAGEAIPPLERALADSSEFVRSAAAAGIASLHKLGYEKPPEEAPPAAAAADRPGGHGSGV